MVRRWICVSQIGARCERMCLIVQACATARYTPLLVCVFRQHRPIVRVELASGRGSFKIKATLTRTCIQSLLRTGNKYDGNKWLTAPWTSLKFDLPKREQVNSRFTVWYRRTPSDLSTDRVSHPSYATSKRTAGSKTSSMGSISTYHYE